MLARLQQQSLSSSAPAQALADLQQATLCCNMAAYEEALSSMSSQLSLADTPVQKS
jgi:hypothetical protein